MLEPELPEPEGDEGWLGFVVCVPEPDDGVLGGSLGWVTGVCVWGGDAMVDVAPPQLANTNNAGAIKPANNIFCADGMRQYDFVR